MIFPIKEPNSPATLPAILTHRISENKRQEIVIDHWGDASVRDNVKFWTGSGGYPGVALARDAVDLFRADVSNRRPAIPFLSVPPKAIAFDSTGGATI